MSLVGSQPSRRPRHLDWRGLARPDLNRTQLSVALLRALILMLAVALLTQSMTVGIGVLSAMLGTLLGMLAADVLRNSPLRLAAVCALCALVALVGSTLSRLPVYLSWPGALLGPVGALQLGEALLWFSLCAPFFFALRTAAQRRPMLSVLEVLFAAAAWASSFAAHREGMVHRPLAIGDWAWSRGIDPAMVLLLIGGVAAMLLAGLIVAERERRRLPLHFSALAAIAVLLFASVRLGGLPVPQPPDGLGLTGDPSEEASAGRPSQDGTEGEERRRRSTPGEMEFRDEYDSDGNRAPVAVVVLHDDYAPPAGVYYFRQSALSQYNGNRLVQATRDDVDQDIVRLFPTEPTVVPTQPPPLSRRFSLRTTVGLIVDHIRPFALDSPALVQPLPNPNPLRFQRAFEAVSRVPITPYEDLIGQRVGSREWTPSQWAHYTELPTDPRYEALAREVIAELPERYRDDPLARALTIKFHLEENGTYSLKSRHASAADPTASFLFGDLTGYCVHFAHAATYLFRSLGIPARVAVGYAVPESHRGESSSIMIRGANAHAWPEIFLEQAGWTVVDLAPQNTLDDPLPAPDPSLQSMLGEMMRRTPGEQDEYVESQRVLPTLAELVRLALWLLLAVMAAALAVKVYRRMLPQFVHGPALYRVTYRADLDRLADVGLRRHYGETRELFALRTRTLAPAFESVTREHLAWALGSRRLREPESLNELSEELRHQIEQRVPAWRRTLGLINPFSWLGVR